MNNEGLRVSTVGELRAAATNAKVRQIVISAPIGDVPTLRLSPGQTLTGAGVQSALRFAAGSDGLELSTDNLIEGLQLVASPNRRVIFNDTRVEHSRSTSIART